MVLWKIFHNLLLKITKNNYENNLCKKVKTLVNTKSNLILKKSNDLNTFENSYFLFQNSPSSVILMNKELSVALADNDIDTDRTFNVMLESILTWENSELQNELELS